MVNCSSVSPRLRVRDCETSTTFMRTLTRGEENIHVPLATSLPLPLLAVQIGHSMGTETSRNVSAHAFSTKGVSTRMGTSDRILRHLFYTYPALEHLLDGVEKTDTFCGPGRACGLRCQIHSASCKCFAYERPSSRAKSDVGPP